MSTALRPHPVPSVSLQRPRYEPIVLNGVPAQPLSSRKRLIKRAGLIPGVNEIACPKRLEAEATRPFERRSIRRYRVTFDPLLRL